MLNAKGGSKTTEGTPTQTRPARELMGLEATQEDLLTFLALFSHDVGGSVGAASLAVETLRNRWDKLEPGLREELLGYLDGRLHRLDGLIRDLRSLAASARPLRHPERVDLADVVDAELEATETTGRHLAADLSPAPVSGAPEDLALMVRKLLDNAFTHPPLGAHVYVSLGTDDATVRLVVEDDGPGVPTDLRERIFAPFNRGDAPRSRAGLGIGLALVAAIAARHDGAIGVGDRPEGGIRFVVEVPAAAEEHEADAER